MVNVCKATRDRPPCIINSLKHYKITVLHTFYFEIDGGSNDEETIT